MALFISVLNIEKLTKYVIIIKIQKQTRRLTDMAKRATMLTAQRVQLRSFVMSSRI